MRWTSILACTALILSGCSSNAPSAELSGAQSADDATPAESDETAFCSRLASASDAGNLLMQGAFTSTKGGEEFSNAAVIENLVRQEGYRFIGADLLGTTCWAYAQAKGTMYDKPVYLSWRCPVKAYSDDPTRPGRTVVELVESQSCDFSVDRGDPVKRQVDVLVIKM